MQKLGMYVLVFLLVCVALPSFAEQVKIYDNTLNLSSQSYGASGGICYGEFIHLGSATSITAIDLGYYCPEGTYGGGVIDLSTALNQTTIGQQYSYSLTTGNNGLVHLDLGTDPTTNPFYNNTSQDVFMRFYFSDPSIGILLGDSAGIGSTDATVYQASWGPPTNYAGITPVTLGNGQHLAVALYTTVVPEPGAFAILASGLAGLLAFRKRR